MHLSTHERPRSRLRMPLATGMLVVALVFVGLWVWWRDAEPFGVPPTATPQPTPTSWPFEERIDSPAYGVNVHMWWDPWAAVRRDWRLVEEAGFTWAKQRMAWHDVEGAGPGRYEWAAADRIVDEAEAAGINLVFRIDMAPPWSYPDPENEAHTAYTELPAVPPLLGDFCETVATRYRGRVRGYQVWNEPNLAREWLGRIPDPAGYVELLRACYVGIKKGDPDALVITAGLAPTGSGPPEAIPDVDYLRGMYDAGASPYYDLLGLHAPGYKAPPEIDPRVVADPERGWGGHRSFCFRHVEDMREIMVTYGEAHKQVAVMEFGWHTNSSEEHPDYAWFAVTPERQGAYLVRAFRYAHEHWAPWIGPMFVWNMPDPQWTPEYEEFWWSIVDPFWWGGADIDHWPGAGVRPAYEAIKEMDKP